MPRPCDGCAGGCSPTKASSSDELTRRDFLRWLGVGAVALYGEPLLVQALAAGHPAQPGSSVARRRYGRYPATPPRVYSGENLGAVAMPIGGIGTGTIWLDGQGRLRVWQIFNNSTEPRVPCSFLAMRVQPRGAAPQLRVLQTEPEPGFPACKSLSFEGGYPIARLDFETGLPVSARLEAFNPMIPTDTDNSSLPCAILRVTVRNRGRVPAQVALLSTLQNAVGYDGDGEITGVAYPTYGGNINAPVRERGLTAISMTSRADPPWTGFLGARDRAGRVLGADPILWLGRLDGPAELARAGAHAMGGLDALSRLSGRPAAIVSAGATAAFFDALATARQRPLEDDYLEVFEDFEGPTYDEWTARGEAFGTGPSPGTHPGQQKVSGFHGRGLVNTFLPNDGPQGRLVSRTFTIRKGYIGFLIGGGNHPDQTCVNLWVDGKIVRTATGRNRERLEVRAWDVREFAGKNAMLEIVDSRSDAWGHVNVDHIVFSDVPPDNLAMLSGAFQRLAKSLPLSFSEVETVNLGEPSAVAVPDDGPIEPPADRWRVKSYVRLRDLSAGDVPPEVLARVANGDPVLLKVPFGQATLVLSLAPDMPWSWAKRVICYVADLDESSVKLETTRSGWGTMALCAAGKARPVPAWTDPETLASKFLAGASIEARADEGPSPPGTTVNGALCVPFSLDPGEERTATFFVTWHFPNVERFGHQGNYYCEMFRDAMDAARYVAANLKGLTARTFLYHQTVYQSNIPEEFLDAITSQSVILRGPTCWRSAEGYFGGYEGAYRCCPLNCTHVWNYAQTHARLFPEIGRNMRVSDFLTYLHESGETSHRQHAKTNAFADGHCACIEAAFREHTLSPDDSFLRGIYPNVKKAMEWFIKRYDKAEEGVTRTHQWNTYDTAVSGLNTFIGSQYLSALAASEAMARAMGDDAAAARWRALRERGSRTQNESLWGGAYYVQIPEDPPAHDYNNGCHSDQLLGQWWAHQLNLGYLYPRARVKQACESIFKYNFKKDFTGLPQVPRRYVDDGDGGLYMCTWPNDDRPDPFTLYSVEVWTGIEYSTAGLMVFEGLVDQARTIVRTARARYDGRPRQRLNSGAGVCGAGNPFQELECGKFYARAQSSWALLIACQGLVLDGPAGILGFKPRWEPDDHRSFFTVPEGWGLFVQRREGGRQTERLELRHGRARVKELVFESPAGAPPPERCIVRLNGRHRRAQLSAADDAEVRIVLSRALRLIEGDVLEVIIRPATK